MALAGPAFCTGLQCGRNRGAGGAIASQILAGLEANPSPLQFIYSKKATKFEEISILVLTLLSTPTPWLTLLLVLEKIVLIKFGV